MCIAFSLSVSFFLYLSLCPSLVLSLFYVPLGTPFGVLLDREGDTEAARVTGSLLDRVDDTEAARVTGSSNSVLC